MNFTAVADVAANLTTNLDNVAVNSTIYYRIRATNNAGFSTWVTAVTPAFGAPAAPANLAATLTATNQLTLVWVNSASNATGLHVERSLDGTSYSWITSLATNMTSYADGGLLYSTTYFYRIRATNGAGASLWTGVSATTLSAPVMPPNPSDISVTNFPYQGITYVVRTNTAYGDGLSSAGVPGIRTVVMHVVVIDLATPGLQFRLTPQAGTNDTRRQTTLNYCTQQVAQVAVNTHFFLPVSSEMDVVLAGLAASDGNVYSSFKSQPIAYNKTPGNPAGTTLADQSYAIVDYAPALNIDSNNGVSVVTRNPGFADNKHVNEPVTLHNTVAGNFQIISNGVKTFPAYVTGGHGFNTLNPGAGGTTYSASNPYYASTDKAPRARTAIGYTADNKLVLFTIDESGGGNGSPSQGAKITEIAGTLLTDYHCTNALNCDGGTSTTLVLQSPTDRITRIVNQSSDSAGGRAEGANLVVFAPAYSVIAVQPVSRLDTAGSTATFSVTPRATPASYQWFKDGAALAGKTNATLALANVQTGDAGGYTVAVSNYYGAQTSSVATLTVNHLPAVNAAAFTRPWYGGFKARTNSFAASDADGDALTLALATASAHGAALTRRGEWFFYRPPAGFTNADTFGFTFSDARGGAANGTATVAVSSDPETENSIAPLPPVGAATPGFVGVPGRTYAVQFTDDLHPGWQTFTNITADALGAFTAIDTPPGNIANRIYRAVIPRP